MRVRIQPAVTSSPACSFLLTSFVVDDRLAVDAGSLGLAHPLHELSDVSDVLLTHCHIDHVATLPIYIERRYSIEKKTTVVHANDHTIDSLRQDVFNGRLYPDLLNMPEADPPFLELRTLAPQAEASVAGYRVIPVAVSHTVPCFGYILQSDAGAVVFGGDSGPTQDLWTRCERLSGRVLLFLECSFPNRMEEFALLTRHLTPSLLARELERAPPNPRVIVTHIKADFYREVTAEIKALGLSNVEIGDARLTYTV